MRARGANIIVPMAFSEAGYGTVPSEGFRAVGVSSIDLGEEQGILTDDTLGRGRDPQDGGDDVINNEGQVTVGVDLRHFGLWLKAMFGAPTTTQGVAATGSLAFSANPANNSTVTINGAAVTFVTGAPTAGQVKIGATVTETLANLTTYLNASAATELVGATYSADTDGRTLRIVFDALGTAGNSYTLAKGTSPNPNVTLSGATLAGGSAAGPYNHVFDAGGIDIPDFALEIGNPEVPSFRMNYGVKADSLSIQMQRSGLLNAVIQLVAQGESKAATSQAGTLETPEWPWERFSQFSGYVEADGVPLGHVESATLRAANNLDKDESIRADGRIGGADPAMLTVGLDLTARFADTALMDKAEAKASLNVRLGWTRGAGQSLTFLLGNVRLPRRKAPIAGPAGVRTNYSGQAFEAQATQRTLRVVLVNDVAEY